jgi:hypothetical protein
MITSVIGSQWAGVAVVSLERPDISEAWDTCESPETFLECQVALKDCSAKQGAAPRDLITIAAKVFEEIQEEMEDRAQLELIGWGDEDIVDLLAKQLGQTADDFEQESEFEKEENNDDDQFWLPKSAKNKFIAPVKRNTRAQK